MDLSCALTAAEIVDGYPNGLELSDRHVRFHSNGRLMEVACVAGS